MRFISASEMIGHTPYVEFTSDETGDARLFIKLEGYNPTGSIKDRTCFFMIDYMLKEGHLKTGMKLLDASSGNFASSLAFFGKLLGFPTEVVVSSKITKEKQKFIEYFGAKVTEVGHFTIDGNVFCQDIIAHNQGTYCFLDQLHSWANPQAHFEILGPEILEDFPGVGAVVGSLGSGGTMLGVGRYLKANKPGAKIITVQASSGTSIPGTGSFDDGDYITPFIKEGMEKGVFDTTIKVSQSSALRRTLQLRDKGIFCGLQTGAVLEAALQLAGKREIEGDVVVISGDSGWKNLDKLINLA